MSPLEFEPTISPDERLHADLHLRLRGYWDRLFGILRRLYVYGRTVQNLTEAEAV